MNVHFKRLEVDFISIYKDLTKEIWLHKELFEGAEISFKYWDKQIAFEHPNLITAISSWQIFKLQMEEEKEIITQLTEKKNKIDKIIASMGSGPTKVNELHCLGFKSTEISEMTNYSVRNVQRFIKGFKMACSEFEG